MKPEEIKKAAVIGLGTMGPGIAQALAGAGCRVLGYDSAAGAAEASAEVVRGIVETMREFEAISPEAAAGSLSNIAYVDSLAQAVAEADLVVEVVSENREIKRAVYAEIDKQAPAGALIWSNTSTLNIYELMPEARLPQSIIAHWFAPPHILPLVEVVKDPRVDPETVATTLALLEKMGKTAIQMERFVPGFAINRIQRLLGREVFYLLGEGLISPEDLDLAVKASIAPRMMILGLVQRMDFTGLDLSARNLLDKEFYDPPVEDKPAALYQKIDQGDLGVKTGKGFYDYSDRDIGQVLRDRDRYLFRVMKCMEFCLEKKRLV